MKKLMLILSVLATFGVADVLAVDPAVAAAELALLEAMAVESKAVLAEAALSGDVDAIAEAEKRSDATDAAVAQAQEAFAAMEIALENGDLDAAESSYEDIQVALESAYDASNGAIPEGLEATVETSLDVTTSGVNSRPYDPPNVYNDPSQTQTSQDFYQSHFGNLYESGTTPSDRDTTPE